MDEKTTRIPVENSIADIYPFDSSSNSRNGAPRVWKPYSLFLTSFKTSKELKWRIEESQKKQKKNVDEMMIQ
jgi:hypothetical protein